MPLMATKDPNSPKRQNRTTRSLHVRVKPELLSALIAAAEEGRRKLVQEVVIALEAHLIKLGRWPPAEAKKE